MRENESFFKYPQIRFEFAKIASLNPVWKHLTLADSFWRLYHNDSYGAGVFLKGKRFELLPDHIYILPPHCNMRTWCDGNPNQLYIHFEIPDMFGSDDFLCSAIPLNSAGNAILEDLAQKLVKENSDCVSTKFLALSFVSWGVSRLPSNALSTSPPDDLIADSCEFIRRNLEQNLDLKSLSMRVHMAENTFLRRFRIAVGTTPYRYLLRIRYARAARMLEADILSIDEICENIGVRDRFHFSRTFRRLYGIPPAEYRRKSLVSVRKNI